ncbi:MAG: 50S ribosomal protein L3 [Candidatus Woesearchaeota archaeon]|jgi:large subunit ribosomal protein L3|nr:50S ribosomal protein L3 [Candidatus Woesearchaeota archaeon]MDP7610666.1 50S ribosomal protein L3 [Candidatus Woesearchaeota archaeon]|tara:strand:+ start:1996 stop:2964 length:969 start_codon:yes stop_codon:yes gene_type:complete
MPTTRSPRKGSLQYWPRKRARKQAVRVKCWAKLSEKGILGFAGYKAGMTHITFIDNNPNSLTKGKEISCPVTVIESPPLKTASIRFYKQTSYGLKICSEIFAEKVDKELGRKIVLPKKKAVSKEVTEYDDLRILVYTQPKLTGIGKKKPEIFEVALSGSKEDQLTLAKESLGKEIDVSSVFKETQLVDVHAVSKGKGFQGTVKRFGVSIRGRKSEKTKRGPGNVGPWTGAKMWRVPYAGQTGYHTRTEYNKLLLKISTKPEEINPKGGFLHYGFVKNPYILLKGTVPGPAKRMIRFNQPIRATKKLLSEKPEIVYISQESKQ